MVHFAFHEVADYVIVQILTEFYSCIIKFITAIMQSFTVH